VLEKKLVRAVYVYSLPWAGTALITWSISLLDRYIVSFYHGAAMAGMYIAAYQIGSSIFQFLGGSMGFLLQPVIFSRAASSEDLGTRSFTATFKILSWISIPLLAYFTLIHEWLLKFFTGPDYWGTESAVLIVGIGIFFRFIGNIGAISFSAFKRTDIGLYINTASMALNVFLCIRLIPGYGIIGAALATLLTYISYAATNILISSYIFKWTFPIKRFLLASIASVLSYMGTITIVSPFLQEDAPAWNFLLISITFAALISACGLALNRKIRKDLREAFEHQKA
jgi:O-antigen/teichoic acid export membrane protein